MIFYKKLTVALMLSFGILINPALANSEKNQAVASTQAQTVQAQEKTNFSPIFIGISDVMGLVKKGDTQKGVDELTVLASEFDKLVIRADLASEKQAVHDAFANAINSPNETNLSDLSTNIYALEKLQNPVDYRAKRKEFAKKVTPELETLKGAINNFDNSPQKLADLRSAYDRFNRTWVANERVVRNTSMAHYGKIETPLALIRVAIESSPPNHEQIKDQFAKLESAVMSYNNGEEIKQVKKDVDLNYGIDLLKDGLVNFQNGKIADAQSKLGEFIDIWVMIEGDVSTRNPALYRKVESQIPIIMATGEKAEQQANLQNIIDELAKINPKAQYTAIDSMLILLREGLEALLIVMALITALKAAKQASAKKYVYAGVMTGLLASVGGAIILQKLFPAMASGANREALEGVVGIVAVFMMLGIGAWLHSKSSVAKWNTYIKSHMGKAMTTGSFFGLFTLAFLSVFREGAETILFYVGILPNISMANFLTGIGMALVILAVTAFIMLKTSVKLPIPFLFKILTWTIYFLGFKILGISLSALQLTNHINRTLAPNLPAIEWAGFFPTVQTMTAQGVYVAIIVIMLILAKRQEKLIN